MSPDELQFDYGDLKPALTEQMVMNHYVVHTHQYFKTVSELVSGTSLSGKSLTELLHDPSVKSSNSKLWHAVCQAHNHNMYWKGLTPNQTNPSDEVSKEINHSFGSIDKMKEEIIHQGTQLFGSGWIWLCVKQGRFVIDKAPNAMQPVCDVALWCIDVWEHAYVYGYLSDREGYLTAAVEKMNWDFVNENYNTYKKQ